MRISSDFNLKIITACVDICELQMLMNVLTSPQLHTGGKTSDVHGRLSVTEREREKAMFSSMEYDYDEALLGCHLWPHTAVFTGLIFKPHSLACCGILVFNAISKQEIDR